MSKQQAPVIFGEVLYDCFPDGRRILGGAPFNIAWHCQAFGLNPLFISRVGQDLLGEKIKSAMQDWGMKTNGLQIDETHPTGIVDVKFINGEPSYDIVEYSAWDFIDKDQLPVIDNNAMLYHGSLALRNSISESALKQIKKNNNLSVYVDINLRKPWWNASKIHEIITKCNWLKLNEEELALIMPDIHDTEEGMMSLLSNNSLEMVILTQGEKGATVLDKELKITKVTPELNNNVVDTVGAGDAFSSILLVGQHYNWPLPISLERAQEFASAIVGIHGATTNDKSFYKPFIEKWKI